MAILAASTARFSPLPRPIASQAGPGVVEDGLHVGEVDVDLAGNRDHLGDGLDALVEDGVGHLQSVFPSERLFALVVHLEQAVVGNDDEGVDVVLQPVDAFLGVLPPGGGFEREGLAYYSHGKCAGLFGYLRDHRGSAGACAAAHAHGQEDHVGAFQGCFELLAAFPRRPVGQGQAGRPRLDRG